jgi:hypothetical protein
VDKQKSNDINNKSPKEKAIEDYKLFDEGKKPVEVAVKLGLSEKEATKYYKEYWRLYRLYHRNSRFRSKLSKTTQSTKEKGFES